MNQRRVFCSSVDEHTRRRTPDDHRHEPRQDPLVFDRRRGIVRRAPLGPGLLLGDRARPSPGPSHQRSPSRRRPEAPGRSAAAARARGADPDSLHRHPEAPPRRNPRRLPAGHYAEPVPRQVRLRLSDQGEPAAPGRRGSAELRRAVRLRPRGRQQAGAAGRVGDGQQRHADHLQRLQGFRIHRDGDARPEDGPQDHPGGREVHRARAGAGVRGEGWRASADRHARQAGRARLGPLAILGRLPLEVRPDGHRNPARVRGAEEAGDGRLPQAAPLPPRQPDHAYPDHQGRAERSRARLLRARQAGRRTRIPGCRRRPRRGLRRLTDQLRVVHELHAPGIRQRRRLPHPDGVRRGRRQAPDHRVGERPRHLGLSQHVGLQRARHARVRRGTGARPRSKTTSNSRSST